MIKLLNEEFYFHGTRAERFNNFDIGKLGTGEGAHAANGIYFATSLKGARNHAKYRACQLGNPLVYVCKMKPHAKILTLDSSIKEQSPCAQDLWSNLPVWLSTKEGKDWFFEIGSTPESLVNHRLPMIDERQRCTMLKNFGVDVLRDFESGAFCDSYLHGRSHLVLNADVIEIVDVIDVNSIQGDLYDSVQLSPYMK
ncbi:hypothetical protein OH460_08625 [Vibrio sp. Makdt]|uniref:hypothetical protein n=1 Tax=Vibrio sp. Makdt TaxID=2998828 RepID=UPI0022CD8A11|nr:hypothetical protein [Vibrio sp. Makdt]MDA0152365.1 hypothetical protein [Vibrio sp. Makdt]